MRKRKRKYISTIILIIVFLVGLSLMLYPTISDFLNTRQQSKAIANYDSVLNQMDDSEHLKMKDFAEDYNQKLYEVHAPLENYNAVYGYEQALDVTGTGIMGYITIPKIDVQLPIYHGTSPEVLNVAVGHLQGSSLPIGGVNTHAVISAHRGLPSAKLFSDLDRIDIGDTFEITVLNEVIRYSVDEINVVTPDDLSNIQIVEGRDLVTLITCTPYGINTHRLLVRGTRIETNNNEVHSVRVGAEAIQVEPTIVACIIAVPFLTLISALIIIGIFRKKRARRRRAERIRRKNGGDYSEK